MINPDSDDQNIPGLDDLLDSIRGESGRDNSSGCWLFMYQMREKKIWSLNKLMKESLASWDWKTLLILITLTYKTLLKEKMMEGRMNRQ